MKIFAFAFALAVCSTALADFGPFLKRQKQHSKLADCAKFSGVYDGTCTVAGVEFPDQVRLLQYDCSEVRMLGINFPLNGSITFSMTDYDLGTGVKAKSIGRLSKARKESNIRSELEMKLKDVGAVKISLKTHTDGKILHIDSAVEGEDIMNCKYKN